MSPEIILGIITGVAGMLISFMTYRVVSMIVANRAHSKALKKYPNAVPAENICTGRHDWYTAYLALTQYNLIGNHQVCAKCGYISGTELKLNEAGIEAVNEVRAKQKEKERYARIIKTRVDFDLSVYVDSWIDSNKNKLSELIGTSDSDGLNGKFMEFLEDANSAKDKITTTVVRELAAKKMEEGQVRGEGEA